MLQAKCSFYIARRRLCLLAIAIAASVYGGCSHTRPAASRKTTAELADDLLDSNNDRIKIAAARALGDRKDAEVIPALTKALDDSSIDVEISAIHALGQTKDPRSMAPLSGLLNDVVPDVVKSAAVRALGKLHDGRAAEAVVPFLPKLREDAVLALVMMGPAAVEPLIVGIHDSNTRPFAIETLSIIGEPAVLPLIRTVRSGEGKYVQQAAARALAEIPDPRADEALDTELKSGDQQLAAAAYRFLIRQGRPGMESHLAEILHTYGDLRMAKDFIQSGNPSLKATGEAWAKSKNYILDNSTAEASQVRWGAGLAVPHTQLALFHFDGTFATSSGIAPVESKGASMVAGRWGTALSSPAGSILRYNPGGDLNFATGTIELWLAPCADGADPVYSAADHPLVQYALPNGDEFVLAESPLRIFYAGSVVSRKFAGVGGGDISSWKAGDWHHVAFTYSAASHFERLYIDGVEVSEHQEAMTPPKSGGQLFLNGDAWGHTSGFLMDELRISSDEKTPADIELDASRATPFGDGDVPWAYHRRE